MRLHNKILLALKINPPDAAYAVEATKKRFFQLLDQRRDAKEIFINIGGTRFYKRHWKVLDYRHPDSRHYDFPGLDVNFDLTSGRPFPFPDGSVSIFYSSHTLEHILDNHAHFMLKEIHRCLKPGGGVRLTMPDFDSLYDCILKDD